MTFQKAGSPFLYDDATGDIVGVRDADGGDSYFARLLASGALVGADGSDRNLLRLGTIGRRIFHGRTARSVDLSANASGTTYHAVFEIPSGVIVDSVRAILVNGSTSTLGVSQTCSYSILSSAADLNGSSGVWADGTLPAATVPAAASTSRRGVLKGDWLTTTGNAFSTYGASRNLIAVRVRVTTAATVTLMGSAADDFTNWASRSTHLVAFRSKAGSYNAASVASGFDSSSNESWSPIAGIEVSCRGRVLNLGVVGDSNDDGRGTYIGAGYGLSLADSLASLIGLPVFYSNLAWPGQTTGNARNHVIDMISQGLLPNLLIAPAVSINDYTADTITETMMNISRGNVSRMLAELSDATKPPKLVLRNCSPVAHTVSGHNHGATDSIRVARNAEVLNTFDALGIPVFDCATPVNGATVSGQVEPAVGMSDDGIHLNDTGISAVLPNALAAAKRALGIL